MGKHSFNQCMLCNRTVGTFDRIAGAGWMCSDRVGCFNKVREDRDEARTLARDLAYYHSDRRNHVKKKLKEWERDKTK